MTNNVPPFEAPYQAVSAAFASAMLEYEKLAEIALESATTSPKTNAKAAGAVTSTKEGVFFLTVPFGEKDEAKALGARWDAAKKKWYVPPGKDRAAFERWIPKR